MSYVFCFSRTDSCWMKHQRLLIAVLFCAASSVAYSENETPGSRTWIERPWEFRYVMRIESPDDYEGWRKLSLKQISENDTRYAINLEAIFLLTTSISTDPQNHRGTDKAIGTVLVSFNRQAEVTSPYDWPDKLKGRLNRIDDLVLASGNGPQDIQFDLGYRYTGRSDAEIAYIPAICTLDDHNERYKKGYSAKKLDQTGNFGCREWGYYLQNPQIPYIDVTSYGSDKSTYIRPVTGWGRFDIPPKPVIGKHGEVWVCIHECPNGQVPGIIPDIKAWAKANGWPVPKPPKKQPMFPDREFKPGEFVD